MVFDGVSYEVTIKKLSFILTFDEGNGEFTKTIEFLYAGNGDIIRSYFVNMQIPITDLESSSEPFALMQSESMGILTTSTDATHTIAIYKAVDGSDDSDLNEYGFYFLRPYVAKIAEDESGALYQTLIFFDDGTCQTEIKSDNSDGDKLAKECSAGYEKNKIIIYYI